MQYTALLQPDGDGWIVTFPSLLEANTAGEDRAEAIANAQDALEVVLLTYAKDGRDLPVDLPVQGDSVRVTPSAQVVAKLSFIEAFRKSGLTRVALAERLGKGENEIRRMLDPYYGSKLPALEDAMRALGKRFVLTVEQAA